VAYVTSALGFGPDSSTSVKGAGLVRGARREGTTKVS